MSDIIAYKKSIWDNVFMTWMFSLTSYYSKYKPDKSNILKLVSNYETEETKARLDKEWDKEKTSPTPSFFKAVLKTYSTTIILALVKTIIQFLFYMGMIILIYYLINFFDDDSSEFYEGLLLAFAFLGFLFLSKIMSFNAILTILYMVANIKCVLTSMMTAKILKLHISASTEENIKGKIINIISADLESLENMEHAFWFLCYPFTFIGVMIVSGIYYGPYGLIAIVLSLLYMPFTL